MSEARPERIRANLQDVQTRIAQALARSGRDPSSVTLVAVTKSVGVEEIRMLRDLGHRCMGESRVQDLVDRAEQVDGIEWHMIGHVQRNKVRRLLSSCTLLHSLDSMRLAAALDRLAAEEQAAGGPPRRLPVLVEVNVSGERSKHGFRPRELGPALDALRDLPHVDPRGLMTMAPWTEDPEDARPVFAGLRELAVEHALPELSMGMSGDYEVAVEEGATLVRVGSALFEGLAPAGLEARA